MVDKTIRHKDFSISLAALEMGTLASGMKPDQIKEICLGHALQWAAEIEGGKSWRDVVPSKIANFLSASIMGVKNRSDSAAPKFDAPRKPKSFAQFAAERGMAQ